MTEDTTGGKIIMKLATAYRINFPGNEKSKQIHNTSDTSTGAVAEADDFSLTDISKTFKITENGDARNSPVNDGTMWDKVFMKLRPPSKSPKGKSFNSGVKFLNRTCEEIVDIIKPFNKNDKQENDAKIQISEICSYISQSDSVSSGDDKKNLKTKLSLKNICYKGGQFFFMKTANTHWSGR